LLSNAGRTKEEDEEEDEEVEEAVLLLFVVVPVVVFLLFPFVFSFNIISSCSSLSSAVKCVNKVLLNVEDADTAETAE